MPRASGLEARIRDAFPDAETTLVESGGGVFEVMKDERVIFSKRKSGRFPEWEEIEQALTG